MLGHRLREPQEKQKKIFRLLRVHSSCCISSQAAPVHAGQVKLGWQYRGDLKPDCVLTFTLAFWDHESKENPRSELYPNAERIL